MGINKSKSNFISAETPQLILSVHKVEDTKAT